VFQHHALYPHMSAYDNMAFGLKIRKHTKEEIERRVVEAARILGIEDCLERKPETLSGGQRQRVALGRAIVRRPGICLMDEPLANLDMETRIQVRAEIARLHQQLGMTMVYVTHDQSEALSLGDRIAVIRRGSIQQIGRPMEVYDQPRNVFVAGFIGSPRMNLFRGTIARKGAQIVFEAGHPDHTPSSTLVLPLVGDMALRMTEWMGRNVILGIRPEHVRCVPEEASTTEAKVEVPERLGAYTDLHLRSSGHSFQIRVPGESEAKPGDSLWISFQTDRAHFFDAATEERISGGA